MGSVGKRISPIRNKAELADLNRIRAVDRIEDLTAGERDFSQIPVAEPTRRYQSGVASVPAGGGYFPVTART